MKKLKIIIAVALIIGILPTFIPHSAYAMTGSGTAVDPYVIYNVTDLQNMSNCLTAYYELNNDIDASATYGWNWDAGRGVFEGFVPISTFTGHFDGNYHTIEGLYVNSDNYVAGGLFGVLGNGAIVGNISAIVGNISITTGDTWNAAGILAGYVTGTSVYVSRVITYGRVYCYCTSAGLRRATSGGLVGEYSPGSSGITEECASYADAQATSGGNGQSKAGGFAGLLWSAGVTIRNCYSRGDATTSAPNQHSIAGGFLGYLDGGVCQNCYSTGAVTATGPFTFSGGFLGYKIAGSCSACFWDKETSGKATSYCGTGKNTTQMKTQSTFTNAGWNFTSIWGILPAYNEGYPYLLWDFTYVDPTGIMNETNQVVWFQPNTIIQGIVLPNRAQGGIYTDGEFSWGDNPANITINMSQLYSTGYNTTYIFPEDINPAGGYDMVGPTGNPDWTREIPELMTNPFYPVVDMIGDQTGIPNKLVWIILATLFLLAMMLLAYRYVPHQIITAIIGGSIASFWYAMGIYPFWVIFIFVIMALAIIIGERAPTV